MAWGDLCCDINEKTRCQFPWFYSTSVLYSTLSATLSKPRATTSYYKEELTSRESSLCGRTGVFCQLKTFCNSPGGQQLDLLRPIISQPRQWMPALPIPFICRRHTYGPHTNIYDTAWGDPSMPPQLSMGHTKGMREVILRISYHQELHFPCLKCGDYTIYFFFNFINNI